MVIRCRNYEDARLQAINILSYFDSRCNKVEITFDERKKCFYVIADEFPVEEYDKISEIMGE